MTCKDCKPTVWCFMHNHSGEWCRDREYLVELCAVHALNERLAEALRDLSIGGNHGHSRINCRDKHCGEPPCKASALLKEYDAAEKEKL